MRVALFCAALLSVPSALKANEYIVCVQNQLNALQFETGPVDGLVDAQMLKALRSLFVANTENTLLAELPGLTSETANEWCAAIARGFPETAEFQPEEKFYAIETSGIAGETAQTLIEELYAGVVRFFER